ncbi:protein arginine N-methyltransferase 1.5-like isoform X4 [Cicer arietinum]|uniref:Protein arginine N-methyltransferase n=1 Tax=Cicer arietinum TaxID=3827 RepID=A0A1S2Y350_CICAR|nr:protein arginine N-methyltransferase 1.5-like isoform X3 [Cicer arietinum]
MPLGHALDNRFAQLCGIEVPFSFDVKRALDINVRHGDFDFLFCPLMYTGYAPNKDKALTLNRQLLPYAGVNTGVTYGQWAGLVFAKISPTWLDLDSEDENVRVNAEAILKQQIEWASYLSVKGLKNMESAMKLLLRIPVGMSNDDYRPLSNALVDSWETWNSFRMLCDHHSQLVVALDIKRVLPPENSLKRWFGEPVTAAILDTEIFLTKARGNTLYLPKRHQKLIADLFHLDTRIVISEIKVPTSAQSAAGSKSQPLLAYWSQVSNIYKQRDPVSEQERSEFYTRDILQPSLRPSRNYSHAISYDDHEKDLVKYLHYEIAISRALLERVPDERASVIATVLVVVGAGRGRLVHASLKAAERTGRKLRVYAVEKNPQTVIALDELIRANNWDNTVSVVSSDVRDWSAPERADILVSDFLGSFGDNELSPESLDAAQRFLEKDGISIPSSYTSFLQPLTAPKLYQEAKARKDILHSESACLVNLHNVARLTPSQQVFTFSHPKCSDNQSNQRYQKLEFRIPTDTGSAMVHGFAGYFNATLYKSVLFGTEPSTMTPNLNTWLPMFFPLRTPICVHRGSILEVHFWRCVDSRKVWYEWCVTSPSSSPIHNCNGRSCWMDL